MSKMFRPVKCCICEQQMYYSDDKNYVPELTLEIKLPKWQEAVEIKNMPSRIAQLFGIEKLYAHVHCWNELPITLHNSNL
jgi:hypothetical protein